MSIMQKNEAKEKPTPQDWGARELNRQSMFLLEVVHDSKYLLSDNYETIKATEILAKEGFVVMPYMYPDLNAARELADVGAACVMPLGAPIGSNKGFATKDFIQILIDEIDLPPRGLEFLKEVCNSVTIPVYAIGGIKLSDVQMDEIIKCGAKGGCIMAGMMSL